MPDPSPESANRLSHVLLIFFAETRPRAAVEDRSLVATNLVPGLANTCHCGIVEIINETRETRQNGKIFKEDLCHIIEQNNTRSNMKIIHCRTLQKTRRTCGSVDDFGTQPLPSQSVAKLASCIPSYVMMSGHTLGRFARNIEF